MENQGKVGGKGGGGGGECKGGGDVGGGGVVRGFPRQAVWGKRWEASEKGRGWGVGCGGGDRE